MYCASKFAIVTLGSNIKCCILDIRRDSEYALISRLHKIFNEVFQDRCLAVF